ncbi:MAG TPA: chromosome partitioning protein ParB, partial [Azonexus sp.]|nr:chromosome partitioning protein ParB [Azonexus sp.]
VAEATPPWETPAEPKPQAATAPAAPRSRVSPGKVKLVAELLGLSEDDEEELLVRLIDEYLALKGA